MTQYKFEAGDIVEIINDYTPWNGTVATVKSTGADPEFPIELVVLRPGPHSTRGAGENIGGWPEYNVRHLHDRSVVDAVIASEFPHRNEVFYNDLTGNAVVLDMYGKFHRILSDGTIDGA